MKLLEELQKINEISRADVNWGSPKDSKVYVAATLDMGLDGNDPSIIVHGVFTGGAATAKMVARKYHGEVFTVPLNKVGDYYGM